MTTATSLSEYGRQLKFKKAPKSIFGIYHGYLVNIIHDNKLDGVGNKTLFLQTGTITEENQGLLARKLSTHKEDIGYDGELAVTEDTVAVSFAESLRKTKPEKIDKALDIILEGLQQFNVPARFTEEQTRHYGHYVLQDIGVVMDENEARTLMRELEDHEEQRKDQENGYGMGAVGAIAGGMLGVALWVAVAYFTGYITTLGAFVIVFLSYFGYQKLNGKLGPLTKPLLIVINLLLIVVAQFLSTWAEIREMGFSVGDTFQLVTAEPDVRQEFLVGLALPLVFMVIAIFYIVRDVSIEGVTLEKAAPL